MSKIDTTAKLGPDGTVLVTRRGRTRAIKPAKPRAMTEAEILAAAESDPDNPPMTAERLARMKPVPRVRSLRRALDLTQEEFAERYRIPLGTLRDWEQGRSQPDQPTRAYLLVIARDPEGVRKALQRTR